MHEWLTIHHTVVDNDECGGKKYHVFAVAEYPIFGSKHEYINTNIAIPLGPLSIDVGSQRNHFNQRCLTLFPVRRPDRCPRARSPPLPGHCEREVPVAGLR